MDGVLTRRFDYLREIWNLRYFWLALVHNDLESRYRHSFLGIGWSLLRPLAMTFILCMVFAKFFNLSIAEYAPYLIIGMTTWQFFTESLLQGCYTFDRGKAYIRQQKVPLAIFPLRTVLGSAFHGMVALVMALAVTWFFRGFANPSGLLYLLPGLVILFFLGWSLAIVAGVIFTHFPDTNHLVEIGLQILFYLTPIMWRPESLENRARLTQVLEWNPLTSILAMLRTPILEGTAPALIHVQVSVLFLIVVGSLAILMLRKLERTLVFWI